MLRPIDFHSALQNAKIPFNDNFFHPIRQGFSRLWILRLQQTGFKKRQGRVRISQPPQPCEWQALGDRQGSPADWPPS